MSTRTVSRILVAAVIAVSAGLLLKSTDANAGLRGTKLLDQTGCQRCPECNHVCNLSAEQVEVEKKCFEVESKIICIPRVVFPWQKKSCNSCDGQGCNACIHNGARTKEIRVLKTKKVKACPVCEYSWSAEENPCAAKCNGCDKGCGGCADSGACDAPCDAGPVVAEPQAAQLKPVEVL